MSGHALLSPSSATRWMACTPSAVLSQNFENTSSSYAQEGTTAHELCEAILREMHGQISKAEFDVIFENIQKSKYYDSAMLDYCEQYAAYVNEQCVGDYHLFIEQKLDMTNWVEGGTGTADGTVILPAERKIIFTDLKYGKGLKVDAKQNSQLKIYALGVLQTMQFIFGDDAFDTVMTTIYQPRLDNISEYSYTVKELLEWAENDLKPKAILAFAGEGEFKAGPHCGFCLCKAKCKALADFNMELAKHDFQNPDLLTDEELIKIYQQKDIFDNWISAVGDYIFNEALTGKKWEGFKLVAGRSVRQYSDQAKVAEALKVKGYTDVYKPASLLGLGELEKRITKVPFNEIVGPLLIKPEGRPTLVSENDKRPTWAPSPENDFEAQTDSI